MNAVARAYRSAVSGLKAFVMSWASRSAWSWGGALGRSRYDYAGNVGDGRGNAIVVACILWLARTFPEAPIRVLVRNAAGDPEPQPAHPLADLLARPNPRYSGVLLWMATIADWMLGNAYWLKVRSANRRVVELWWVPSGLMEPKFPEDGSEFLSHYEYNPNGTPIKLDPADVVHFRYGLDPRNQRKGLSPLGSLLREVFTDDEAANFSASLLRNLGVPGVVISPDEDVTVSQEDADRIKAEFRARTGGDNRGDPVVITGKTKVSLLSFSPQQMDLKVLRRLPEERITAIFGVPAIVVGLGAGLDRSTFANYAEAREAAYESNVIPTQRLLAAELTTQLLPEFGDPARLAIDFDLSQVRVLQPDLDSLFKRLDVGVRGGWVTPDEARSRVGLDALPAGGDVLYVPVSAVPTPPEEIGAAPEAAGVSEPTPLRALPPAKARRRSKSARAFADGLARIRSRHRVRTEADLAAFLEGQRARVIGRLNAQEKAFRPEDLFDVAAEARALKGALERWYKRVLGSVHGLTEDALGVSFDLDDPTTRAFLAEAGKEIVGITETTRKAIADALREGQALGESVPVLAERIGGLAEFGRPRAALIARTELAHASNAAAVHDYRASGVVVGVRVFDGDGCGLRGHDDPEKADGRVFPLGAMADVPTLAHPACLVGETLVLAPNVDASFARWFDGEVVVLRTAADDLLTCTPNHPVLTDRGWLAAGSLREGDHVIRCLDAQRVAAILDPDHDRMPTRIEQIADALGPACGGSTATVPTATEAFHGDGAGSQVHVVRTNGLGRRRMPAAFTQPIGEPAVVAAGARGQALTAEGDPPPMFVGVDGTPRGGVGSINVGRVFPTPAQLHADLLQAVTDGVVADAEASGDPAARFAALVAPSEVVHVERKPFSGHVYNLETTQGWYIAEGIITHNCVRAFGAVVDAAELEDAA